MKTETEQSKKGYLNKEDGVKILKGLGISMLGLILTTAAELIPQVDFGSYSGLIVALSAVGINAIRKTLAE